MEIIGCFLQQETTKDCKTNDAGPNTGGMGAVCAKALIDEKTLSQIEKEIVEPTIKGLIADQLEYRGFFVFWSDVNGPMDLKLLSIIAVLVILNAKRFCL